MKLTANSRVSSIRNPSCSSTSTITIEVNLMFLQGLIPPSKTSKKNNIQTYVIAYVDPNQKLRSRLDTVGNYNPTWNDKFIFFVDSNLVCKRPNACMVFEIYQARSRSRLFNKDKKIGVAQVLLQNLIPKNCGCGGRKFMAVKVYTDSDKKKKTYFAFNMNDDDDDKAADGDQVILNIGAVRLDDQLSSFVALYDSIKLIV